MIASSRVNTLMTAVLAHHLQDIAVTNKAIAFGFALGLPDICLMNRSNDFLMMIYLHSYVLVLLQWVWNMHDLHLW